MIKLFKMEILDPSNHFRKITNCRATIYSYMGMDSTTTGDSHIIRVADTNSMVNEVVLLEWMWGLCTTRY